MHRASPLRIPAGGRRSTARLVTRGSLVAAADVDVALLLHLDLLLADGAGTLLGVLHLALADRHLLLDHRRLLDAHLLLGDRDADLLAGPDVARGGRFAGHGVALDDHLLALDGHLHR